MLKSQATKLNVHPRILVFKKKNKLGILYLHIFNILIRSRRKQPVLVNHPSKC